MAASVRKMEKPKKNKPMPICCLGFDTDLYQYDLIFPERMSPSWKEFLEAHDIYNETLGDLVKGAIDVGNGKVYISHKCPKLLEDGRCSIYENRPQVCRQYVCGKPDCQFKDLCQKSAREREHQDKKS